MSRQVEAKLNGKFQIQDAPLGGLHVATVPDRLTFQGIPFEERKGLLIPQSKEYVQKQQFKWILGNDFSNTEGAANDHRSPNRVIASFWEVRKRNNPDYQYEQPWFRDDTIVGLRPVNADYRAWNYSRIANKLNEPYVMTIVCDPGVGGDREGVVIKTKKGNYLVGPNNGVFGRVLEDEGIAVSDEGQFQMWKFRKEKFDDIETATFHGETAFGPVSAELCDGKHPDKIGDWLEPFKGKIVLNPLSDGFKFLVPEHASLANKEQLFIPGDEQRLLENDGVNLLRFDGHVPDDAVAARVIVPDSETDELNIFNIPVEAAFVDSKPGDLMIYPGSENPSGIKGNGLTEITASMAVHKGEPTASEQLGLSRKDIGRGVIFQWLRKDDNLEDTSREAVFSYQGKDRGIPERVLEDDGTVRVVYTARKEEQKAVLVFEKDSD